MVRGLQADRPGSGPRRLCRSPAVKPRHTAPPLRARAPPESGDGSPLRRREGRGREAHTAPAQRPARRQPSHEAAETRAPLHARAAASLLPPELPPDGRSRPQGARWPFRGGLDRTTRSCHGSGGHIGDQHDPGGDPAGDPEGRGAGTHHVIGHEGQQDLELVGVDADFGPDGVAGPDGTDGEQLGEGPRQRLRGAPALPQPRCPARSGRRRALPERGRRSVVAAPKKRPRSGTRGTRACTRQWGCTPGRRPVWLQGQES